MLKTYTIHAVGLCVVVCGYIQYLYFSFTARVFLGTVGRGHTEIIAMFGVERTDAKDDVFEHATLGQMTIALLKRLFKPIAILS